jgi:phosphoenolpyruvate carboxykinase (ATP)
VSHTELEEELHETAHIDYDRVAIVRASYVTCLVDRDLSSKGAGRSRT